MKLSDILTTVQWEKATDSEREYYPGTEGEIWTGDFGKDSAVMDILDDKVVIQITNAEGYFDTWVLRQEPN